jgi:hypothetical protein
LKNKPLNGTFWRVFLQKKMEKSSLTWYVQNCRVKNLCIVVVSTGFRAFSIYIINFLWYKNWPTQCAKHNEPHEETVAYVSNSWEDLGLWWTGPGVPGVGTRDPKLN